MRNSVETQHPSVNSGVLFSVKLIINGVSIPLSIIGLLCNTKVIEPDFED